MINKAFIIVLAMGMAACAAVPNGTASSVAAPRASFNEYSTFSFGLADPPEPGYQVTARSLEVQRRLRGVVKSKIEHSGYVEAPEGGDFVVKLATGMVAAGPAEETAGLYRSTPAPTPARGYIGVHVYDAHTGSMIWQSSAVADIDPEHINDALLQRGVDDMLSRFPSARKQATASN